MLWREEEEEEDIAKLDGVYILPNSTLTNTVLGPLRKYSEAKVECSKMCRCLSPQKRSDKMYRNGVTHLVDMSKRSSF
jgi:hypothetical protein